MLKLDVEGCDYVMCCAYVVCLLGQLGVASFEASSAPRMGCWFLQGSSRCFIVCGSLFKFVVIRGVSISLPGVGTCP